MKEDILYDLGEFEHHKNRLDKFERSGCRHTGEPEKFPCKVRSDFWDDPNGPYTYNHYFVYQQEVTCPHCGTKTLIWPTQAE